MFLWCASWFVEVLSCRGNSEINFYISCRRCTVCETNAFVLDIRNLIPDRAFLSKYLLLHQLFPVICWYQNMWNNTLTLLLILPLHCLNQQLQQWLCKKCSHSEFFRSVFFRILTEIYSVILRIQSKCREIRTRKTVNTNNLGSAYLMHM